MKKKIIFFSFFILLSSSLFSQAITNTTIPRLSINLEPTNTPADLVTSLQLLAVFTVLAVAPTLVMLLTGYTRIVIVLSFLRRAMGTQQAPPNQILISLALLLTFFIMRPTLQTIEKDALQPYIQGKLNQSQAIEEAIKPIRKFMIKQTREKDLELFVNIADIERPKTINDVPTTIILPAFVISELKTAFEMGFMIYIPFLIIDMVIASTLMSMGMMMLPPMMISLPAKLLLFILVDGWHLIITSLLNSFR